MDGQAILERIMTQHWDMKACECWVCEEARVVGCRPTSEFLGYRTDAYFKPVRVEWPTRGGEGKVTDDNG